MIDAAINEVGDVTDSAAAGRRDEATYHAHVDELMRFATALVGVDDAADVVATAFVSAIAARSWPTIENRRAYLYRAVFNTARRHQRRRALRFDRERQGERRDRWEMPTLRPEVADAVRRLSVQQRAVIVLTYWADLDPAAIADRLGIGDGTVRRHLARARANLRKVLEP